MFDFDNFREIWSTIKKNKLRTFLTGFSVAWGIFMLILLLGAGNGFGNGLRHNFRGYANNSLSVSPGYANMPYKGMRTNRWLRFNNQDLAAIRQENPEIKLLTGIIFRNQDISYGNEYNSYSIRGVHPDIAIISNKEMRPGQGRFINELDLKERRKVVVIPRRAKEVLFKSEDPLGKMILVGNVPFQVIGIYWDENSDYDTPIYIPFTTAQTLYKAGYGLDRIEMTLTGINTEEASEAFKQKLREQFSRRHRFDPNDTRAIWMWGTLDDFMMLDKMSKGIALFIWIIGIGTLTAGIVGVSNIMLITVRERTREFGIRKAIGATPFSILKLIIIESILITAIFGYIGMVGGIGLTEGINYLMETVQAGKEAGTDDVSVFRNPTVNIQVALFATGLIIIAGVLAGYFPARKAVKITAIEAMRHE